MSNRSVRPEVWARDSPHPSTHAQPWAYYLCNLCRNWRLLDDAAPTAVNVMLTHGIKHLFIFCHPGIRWRVNATFTEVRRHCCCSCLIIVLSAGHSVFLIPGTRGSYQCPN